MKISTYTPVASASITLPSGHAAASANINAYGGKTDTSALDNLMKFATKIQEDRDAQSAFNAMNDYNEQMNNLLYNKENGLMHLQGSAAENVGQTYAEAEKKIRDKVLSDHKVMMRGANIALNNSLGKIATGHSRNVMEHEYKQGEVAKDTTLANCKQTTSLSAQRMYWNPKSVADFADIYSMQAGDRYKGYGDERIKEEMRKARGEIYRAAIEEALAKEDFSAYDNLLGDAAEYLDPRVKASYEKTANTKQRSRAERNIAQEALELAGDNMETAYAYIEKNAVRKNNGVSSNVEKVRALIGEIPFYRPDGTGTNCVHTFGVALKGTPYEGLVNTEVMDAVAHENRQLIPYSPEAARNAKPGDIFIGDGGTGEDDGHAVMKTEKGTIQNGSSGDNGRGGIYESDLPPERMLRSVKWIIRTSDYNEQGQDIYDPESVDRAKRQYDRLIADRKRIERNRADNIYDDIEAKAFEIKRNGGSYEDARAQLVEGKFYNVKDDKAAEQALSSVFAVRKSSGSSSGSSGADGEEEYGKGGHPMAVYAINQMLLNNDPDVTDKASLMAKCKELKLSEGDRAKIAKAYDRRKNHQGEFAYNWNNLKQRIYANAPKAALVSKAAEEQFMAEGQAYAVEKINEYINDPKNHGMCPSDATVVKYFVEGGTKKTLFTYNDPDSGRALEMNIAPGALRGAITRVHGDMVDIIYTDGRTSLSVSKNEFARMYQQ